MSPKSPAQQVEAQPGIVELVDNLLNDHVYAAIAKLLNQQGTARARLGAEGATTPDSPPNELLISFTNTNCVPVMID